MGEIRGRYGYAVDSVLLKKADDTEEFHGSNGGDREQILKLAADELIVSVMQERRHNYLGNAVLFYTSAGRTFEVLGNQAKSRACFVAPSGAQIVGLQFVGSLLQGVHTAAFKQQKEGAVAKISAWVGTSVDKIVFHLRNGKVRSFGSDGGSAVGPWILEPDEHIKIVDQNIREAYLGNSIIFQTSLGKVIRIFGVEKSKTRRVGAPEGSQICGLEFNGPDLMAAVVCPSSGDRDNQRTLRVDT